MKAGPAFQQGPQKYRDGTVRQRRPDTQLYQQAKKQAAVPTDDSWGVAKANLASVHQMMVTSPDLTSSQASALIDEYIWELKAIREKATKMRESCAAP